MAGLLSGYRSAVLYTCRPRTAFHVHTSHLLRTDCGIQRTRNGTIASSSVANDDSVSNDTEMDTSMTGQGSALLDGAESKDMSGKGSKSDPKKSSDAIQRGLTEFEKGEYSQAIDFFTLALELPGNGAVRAAGSPKEYACASEGEERASLYNMACCYSQLGETDSGLTVMRGLLENGFDDYDSLRTDPDLATLRGVSEFESLLASFESGSRDWLGNPKRSKVVQKGWFDRW